jgi:hypothetical protein
MQINEHFCAQHTPPGTEFFATRTNNKLSQLVEIIQGLLCIPCIPDLSLTATPVS